MTQALDSALSLLDQKISDDALLNQQEHQQGWFCHLADRGLLQISGQDPQKFLQGQLTCDLDQLSAQQPLLGACCTPKGRIYSNFRLLQRTDELLLDLDKSLIEPTLAGLGKFAPFFRCSMQDISDAWPCLGLGGELAGKLLQDQGIELPPAGGSLSAEDYFILRPQDRPVDDQATVARWQLWLKPERLLSLLQPLDDALSYSSAQSWSLLDIRQGLLWLNAQTSERYTAHQLNLPALKAVNFKKGCYTGQEIIARMQHLGKTKTRVFRVEGAAASLPQDEAMNLHNGADSIGPLLSHASVVTASGELGFEGLAMLTCEYMDKKIINSSKATDIHALELPYVMTNKEHLEG